MIEVGNGLSKIRHFLPKICPKMGKYCPKTLQNCAKWPQKWRNLRKFVQLGCPDPTPAMYVMKLGDMYNYAAAVPLEVVKGMDRSEYIVNNYYSWLPPDPKNMAKITNL